MSAVLTIVAAAAVAVLVIVVIVRVSMRITSRKKTEELAAERPDASNIHRDSGIVS